MSTRRRTYSVGRWCRDAGEALEEIARQGRVPILVGGTGLYFKALTTGLAAVPPIPAEIRAEVRGRLQREGAPALHAELVRRDPATAQRLRPNDRSRIAARSKWCWRPGARCRTGIATGCRR